MKLLKLYLRYYPPGIILEYFTKGKIKRKILNLFDIEQGTNVEILAAQIASKEPLISPKVLPKLLEILQKIKDNSFRSAPSKLNVHGILKGHLLPITNVSIDKHGEICATGSYDRTCKIWNISTSKEFQTLKGHENAVYTVSLNIPRRNKIELVLTVFRVLTGSFDKTAKIWSIDNGDECLCTMYGHTREIVAADISECKQIVATSSMDKTTRLFSTATGQTLEVLKGHTGEVIVNQFNYDGSNIITGSFDGTIKLWDTRVAKCMTTLTGHTAELSTCCYNFEFNTIASGSLDNTAKIWDIRTNSCRTTIIGHTDEVLDASFDLVGRRLATASSDCNACVWDVNNGDLISAMIGHSKEVSKVFWEPAGKYLLTASQDNSAMLWDTETGECTQKLEKHSEHVFSVIMSYHGDVILTASKDNTCCIWKP